ncbi:MAG: TerD family protein [Atribacterota bacterium]|jgi:tellurium resistance protein TerZ|nr:TerD family protein [Atribacterota bacterium]
MSINLEKGQKISLSKDGAGLNRVAMGLGWDSIKKKSFMGFGGGSVDVDLDASCLMFDGDRMTDVVWFRQLKSKDGSIVHSGDNRTGDGDGDDETINVDLNRVPANVTALIFTVSNFTGQNFSQVENAYCRLVDLSNNSEIAKYNLSAQGNHTGQILAKLYRHNGAWKMHAIGENGAGRTFDDMMPQIKAYL